MHIMRHALTVTAGHMLLAAIAFAQDDIETDRPDQTETATTVAAGRVQIEAGFAYERDVVAMDAIDTIERTSMAIPTVLVRVGISDGFELRLESGAEHLRSEHSFYRPLESSDGAGVVSPSIGLKAELMDEDGAIPQTALIADVTFPIGEARKSPGYVAPAFRFSMSHALSDAFALGYNLGAEWDGYSPRGTGIYTVTMANAVTSNVGSYLELFGELATGELPVHSFDGGLTYRPQPNLQFDLSAGIGITASAPDYYLAAGASMRLPE